MRAIELGDFNSPSQLHSLQLELHVLIFPQNKNQLAIGSQISRGAANTAIR